MNRVLSRLRFEVSAFFKSRLTTRAIRATILTKVVDDMPMKSKEMVKLLENNGFRFIRQKGSHAIYHNSATRKTVIVPMHNTDLKKGIEQNILKQAGLK